MDKVICVGKNYLKHAAELGDAIPDQPLLFLKPPSVIKSLSGSDAGPVELPRRGEIHHEVELVFEIKKDGSGWRFSRFTVGLDLTLREVQTELKKAGQPWEKAKVFKNSCILGPWREMTSLLSLLDQPFSISVNGSVRQTGFGKDMRWGPNAVLDEAQKCFPLCDGDLLFTGTPEGVAALNPGDQVIVRGPNIEYGFTVK